MRNFISPDRKVQATVILIVVNAAGEVPFSDEQLGRVLAVGWGKSNVGRIPSPNPRPRVAGVPGGRADWLRDVAREAVVHGVVKIPAGNDEAAELWIPKLRRAVIGVSGDRAKQCEENGERYC